MVSIYQQKEEEQSEQCLENTVQQKEEQEAQEQEAQEQKAEEQETEEDFTYKKKDRSYLCIILLIWVFICFFVVFVTDEISDTEFCYINQSDCEEVRQNQRQYILRTYKEEDQKRSMMRFASNLQKALNLAFDNIQEVRKFSKKIINSVQCLSYILGDNFLQEIYNLENVQLNTQERLKKYLKILDIYSGESIHLTSYTNLQNTCGFQIRNQSRINQKYEKIRKYTVFNQTNLNKTQVLILYDEIGSTIPKLIKNTKQTIFMTSQSKQTYFSGGIIVTGPQRISKEYSQNIFKAYSAYIKLNENQQKLDEKTILNCLYLLKSGINVKSDHKLFQQYSIFQKFYFKHIADSYFENQNKQFTIQKNYRLIKSQIQEGKKVVIVSHSLGSLYTDFIYNKFNRIERASCRFVYLGPVSNWMPQQSTGNYITNPNDKILSQMFTTWKLSYSTTYMPANDMVTKTNKQKSNIFNSHDYLNYINTYKNSFLSLVIQAKSQAEQPCDYIKKQKVIQQRSRKFCSLNPSQCQGVKQQTRHSIVKKYQQQDQIKSVMSLDRSIDKIQKSSSTKEFVQAQRDIFRSTQCLKYTLGENYLQDAQDLMKEWTNTQQKKEKYLKMIQSFSGQPLKMAAGSQLQSVCDFKIKNTEKFQTKRNREQSIINKIKIQENRKCYGRTETLILFDEGFTVNKALQSLSKTLDLIQSRQDTYFDDSGTIIGPRRKKQGHYDKIISQYQNFLKSKGQKIIQRSTLIDYIIKLIGIDENNDNNKIFKQFQTFAKFFYQYELNEFYQSKESFDFNLHVQLIRQQLSQGKKIVLVAHSLGTLHINAIYDKLSNQQKKSCQLVYLAPVVNQMPTDNIGRYITDPNDIIINSLSSKAPSPLPSNNSLTKNFPIFPNDELSHSYNRYILQYSSYFLDMIASAKKAAILPHRTLGQGPITVQLTWDSQPDIDLHVFEPTGAHVYYSNKKGVIGHLDLDDTTGFGPQHYYTKCQSIRAGSYKVSLNYYSGRKASKALVRIKAGTSFELKTLELSPAIGSSGNTNPPYKICQILVTYNDKKGYYSYKIIPL